MYIVFGEGSFGGDHFGIGNTIEEAVKNYQSVVGDDNNLPEVYYHANEIKVTRKIEYIITDEVC